MAGGTPFLATVTKGLRTALPYFESLSAGELGSTAIVKAARAAGYSFQTQQAFDLIAAIRGTQSGIQYLRSLPVNVVPNGDRFGVAPNRILRKYSYRVSIRTFNAETGQHGAQDATISTNDPLSQQQVLDKAMLLPVSHPGSDLGEVTSATITNVFQSP